MTPAFVLSRGDIVLTKFPYSDLAGFKLRPALVVSPGFIGQEVIAVAISTVVRGINAPYDVLLDITHPEFSQSGLRFPSVFRTNKLVTLDHSLVLRRLGKLGAQISATIDTQLRAALAL